MSRFLEEARSLLSISSVSPDGTDELIHHLSQIMEASGLFVKTQSVRTSISGVQQRQINVLGSFGLPLVDRKIQKGLLFLAPLDTGAPGLPADWSQTGGAIWDGTVRGDRIYGSGVCDGKISFLCMLTALRKFRGRKTRMPLYLVGTCGEKLGGLGTRYLLESWALNPLRVIVGKPTGMAVAKSSPAAAVLQLSIRYQAVERGVKDFTRRIQVQSRGLGAPASHPQEGVHAIEELMRVCNELVRSDMEVKWSQIRGGSLIPQVPDTALAEFFVSHQIIDEYKHHIRSVMAKAENADRFVVEMKGVGDTGRTFLPGQIMEAVQGACARVEALARDRQFRQCLTEIHQEAGVLRLSFFVQTLSSSQDLGGVLATLDREFSGWSQQFPSFAMSCEKTLEWPALVGSETSSPSSFESVVGRAMEKAKLSPNPIALDVPTEAGLFGQKGYDTFIVGPGVFSEGGMRPNEFNSLDQLEGAIRFYENLIWELCE